MRPAPATEFEKLEARLRRGAIPRAWRPLLSGADPATVLIMMWAGRLSRRVEAFYQGVLRPYGLRYPDYAVLSILRFSGPMSPKNLNRSLAITSGGLTKSIDRLEAAGRVRRGRDPEDGRGTLVALTKKGERTIAEIFDDDLGAHEDLFRDLTAAGRRRIAGALRELLDAFEEPEGASSRPARGRSASNPLVRGKET
jgi:DNA-binding MarR family transcriptional regulator